MNAQIFKPNLMNSIVSLIPAGVLVAIAFIPWVQGDTFLHASKISLLWLGFAFLCALLCSPFYSHRLVFEDSKAISKTWYLRREILYSNIEKLEVYARGPYGALGLKVKTKECKTPWLLRLSDYEEKDCPCIVSEFTFRAPHAELNEHLIRYIKEKI